MNVEGSEDVVEVGDPDEFEAESSFVLQGDGPSPRYAYGLSVGATPTTSGSRRDSGWGVGTHDYGERVRSCTLHTGLLRTLRPDEDASGPTPFSK